MGAHHADHPMPTTLGVRATATAAAVVALSGAGAGIASAHDGIDAAADGGRYSSDGSAGPGDHADRDDCGPDGVGGALTGTTVRAIGLSRDDAAGTCADPSSLGGFGRGGSEDDPSGWTAWGGSDAMSDDRAAAEAAGRGSANQTENGSSPSGQTRPAAAPAQPTSANPIDTPPPPGQSRLIKLPSAR